MKQLFALATTPPRLAPRTWAGASVNRRDEFKPGYLAEFEIKEVDKKNRRLKVELSQVPAVQGAMMTLNAKTGEIVTMVGGYDFYSPANSTTRRRPIAKPVRALSHSSTPPRLNGA